MDVVGVDLGGLAMKLVTTGGIGAVILLLGRGLRRAKGLAVYTWLVGGFLTMLGVLIATGVLEVDVTRILRIGRFLGDVAAWAGRMFADVA